MKLKNKFTWMIIVFFAFSLSNWLGIVSANEPSKISKEMQRCEEAFNAGHWKDAAKWCPIAAEQGNARAQFYLGVMYAHGQGIKQNYAESVNGIGKRHNREMVTRNVILLDCILLVKAYHKTSQRLSSGIERQQSKDSPTPSATLEGFTLVD